MKPSFWKYLRHWKTIQADLVDARVALAAAREMTRTEQARANHAEGRTLHAEQAAKESSLAMTQAQQVANEKASETEQARAEIERQKWELASLTAFVDVQVAELRFSLGEARDTIKRLQDEKHLAGIEKQDLMKQHTAQKIGLHKLTTFIRRRHRPDNLPERLNGIRHTGFHQ